MASRTLIVVVIFTVCCYSSVHGSGLLDGIYEWLKEPEPQTYSDDPWSMVDKKKFRFMLRGINMEGTPVSYCFFKHYNNHEVIDMPLQQK